MKLKKYLPLLCGFLILCAAVALTSPAARAADTGRTITLEAGQVDMLTALKDARDGDTIVLNGNVGFTDMSSKDAPWVIDKAVTIQGGTVGLWASGIILDADVTFRDTTLSFGTFVRNAILANGHTLTLENVRCDQSSQPVVNLFCGGLYDPEGFDSTPGPEGKIIIKGNTSLQNGTKVGNLYAGNLCMGGMNPEQDHINGPANQYNGNATIQIESGTATLGHIYAGGAQQRIPQGSQSGKVILTDPAKYTTNGRVDIRLMDGAAKYVDGAGADEVYVTYNGGAYSTALTVKNVSGLAVETGSLALAAGSGLPANAALGVVADTRLDLTNLGNVTVGSLEGGGTLLLGQLQSLSVAGSVTGQTTVGIFSLNASGCSTMPPISKHAYIHAPQSEQGAFLLAPPDGYDAMQLAKDENGDWSVPSNEAPVLVESVCFTEPHTATADKFVELALTVAYVENDAPLLMLDYIPVTVLVNGCPTDRQVDAETGYYLYTTPDHKLSIEVIGESVCVYGADDSDGTYTVEIIIPAASTGSGHALAAQTVLTIGDATAPAEELTHRILSLWADDAQVVADIAPLDAGAEVSGTVLAAAYTKDGQMCAVSTLPISGAGTVTVPLDSTGADYVTLFVVDATGHLKPVCWKQSVIKTGLFV